MEEVKTFYLKDIKEVEYLDSKYEAIEKAEVLILLTERNTDYLVRRY